MRLLRWKSRYNTGEVETDQHNKKFLECVNSLMTAADEHEHCQDMENLLTQLGEAVVAKLGAERETAPQMRQFFYGKLVNTLPLPPYGTPACHQCGLCDLAQAQFAQHLQAPLNCLSRPENEA